MGMLVGNKLQGWLKRFPWSKLEDQRYPSLHVALNELKIALAE